jgi:Holliday junction resolvase-like predicted endonuclease
MSEAKLQTKVLKWLKDNNYWAIKTVVCNKNGVMDIIACAPTGRFVGIELKYGDNKASPLQLHHISEVVKRGGIAFVAWDLETIIERLNNEL